MKKPAKRIPIVSVKLVKESSLLYQPRTISSLEHLFELVRQFVGDKDREHLLIIGVNVKNEPTLINIAHIGSLTQCVAHMREIMKPLILSNSARFFTSHNHPSGDITASANKRSRGTNGELRSLDCDQRFSRLFNESRK